jgi:hypothetical protein
MSSLSKSPDLLDLALKVGAIRALRARASAQREKAATGITNGEGRYANIIIVSSEARRALDIASDLGAIADELEAGGLL